jgi:hypothetical protein
MNFDFNAKSLAARTADVLCSEDWTSWAAMCRMFGNRGFNMFEAEAILRSRHTLSARTGIPGHDTSAHFERYLDRNNIVPGCKHVNELVLAQWPEFVANEEGVPCERGTMPGNPEAGETLVPVGTPLCCNPHSELYWTM